MEYEKAPVTLFEVSWEVCNKVGGIYSVVSSKALQAVEEFGEEYFLLGPDLKNNAEFEETDDACWDSLRIAMGVRNLKCRFGRWSIPGKPKVILVSFKQRFNQDQLLYDLWNSYGVDSLSGGWDYVEPVMFSAVCAEVITAVYQTLVQPVHGRALAHFHEWMTGAGLLGIKKLVPQIGTIFTTHATMLGRSMAGSGVDIYRQMKQISPAQEAVSHNITAKCSMESTAAHESDCFTTVSGITADEAKYLLGREPDVLTLNGLDMRVIPDYSTDRGTATFFRQRVLEKANRFLRKQLPENTRICVISGRYEFHNKGIDAFLDALAGVEQALQQSNIRFLAICAVMGGHTGVDQAAINGEPDGPGDGGMPRISSHHVYDQPHDPIITTCIRYGLVNGPNNHVQVIFIPAMMDGHDGFLDMTYYELLAACDLGVFPSWYEPWGYTPEESAAYSVPTVTTDLSGFGLWAREWIAQHSEDGGGVTVLQRRQTSYDETVTGLRQAMLEYASCSDEQLNVRRCSVRHLAMNCSWEKFFPYYTHAYTVALGKAHDRSSGEDMERRREVLTRVLSPTASTSPNLRRLTAVAELPKPLARLRELACNMWWCWQPEAWKLFSRLNPAVWESSDHNPVLVIEEAASDLLNSLAQDKDYCAMYERVMRAFDQYMAEPAKSFGPMLNAERPVAYFSTEYGLHESLPIYSGGLGVLSGDHLKSASDLNIPLVAVGLLYRNGYFRQQIDRDGRQVSIYPENNFAELPLQRVQEEANGAPVYMQFELPGRQLFVQIWKVAVGRITLYLMDTDIPMNTADDRKITARLYEADRDYRLRQEILLGMGGVRMLARLGIQPSVYHMNEGHSAFMVLERIRESMSIYGLSLNEAMELVRSNTIFTTHTPVDAGNERFAVELMERYFKDYAETIGLPFQDFMRLGRLKGDERQVFEMTVLALSMSFRSNGVSRLHGVVSRYMWREAWKGVPVAENPIGYVTNGIHVPSYVGDHVRPLLERELGPNWLHLPTGAPQWAQIDRITDTELWIARQKQKDTLLQHIRSHLPPYIRKFDVSRENQHKMVNGLNPSSLVIGFARRFAPYKRATLLFADPDRLARILNDPNRPVILVFSGKAHPADEEGIKLIQSVISYANDPRFVGHIFFIEDYSLAVSRLMVQGSDVWLNTPRRPYEASGTSGQKVPVNGGLNLSISDGWWCEGQGQKNGWTIGPLVTDELPASVQSDYSDAESLYTLLEESVVPLYYDRRDNANIPHAWLEHARQSIKTLTARFSSSRMVSEYVDEYYLPASARATEMAQDELGLAKSLAAWKADVAVRFSSLRLGSIQVNGIAGDQLTCGQPMTVQISINLGAMQPHEILVQLVIGPARGDDFSAAPDSIRLVPGRRASDNSEATFTGTFIAARSGRYAYGIRVMPVTPGLDNPLSTGLLLWA